jgi:cell division septal protein FtsQ
MSKPKSRKPYPSKKTQNRKAPSNLPLYAALAGVLLIALALFVLWKSGQPSQAIVPVEVQGQPSLKVDRDRLDFGDVKLGQTVTATFTLSNVGDETLQITGAPTIQVLEGC